MKGIVVFAYLAFMVIVLALLPAQARGACPETFVPGFERIRLWSVPCQENIFSTIIRGDCPSCGSLIIPDARQQRLIADGLRAAGPSALLAVTDVAIAEWTNCDYAARTVAGKIVIYSCSFLPGLDDFAKGTMVHEATHAYGQLVDAVVSRREAACLRATAGARRSWPDPVTQLAELDVQRTNALSGLHSLWNKLHESGVKSNAAKPYLEKILTTEVLKGAGPGEARRAVARGFADFNGSQDACEDLASFAEAIQYPDPNQTVLCPTLANAQPPYSRNIALLYTKAVVLRQFGLVTKEKFDRCMGNTRLDEAGPNRPGLHLGVGAPGRTKSFDRKLVFGWPKDKARQDFVLMRGTSGEGDELLVLAADPSRMPVGLHVLGEDGNYVQYDEKPDPRLNPRTTWGREGLVVVTEVDFAPGPDGRLQLQRLKGFILFLKLRNLYLGVRRDYPLSTFLFQR